MAVAADARGPTGRPLSRGGGDGRLRARPLLRLPQRRMLLLDGVLLVLDGRDRDDCLARRSAPPTRWRHLRLGPVEVVETDVVSQAQPSRRLVCSLRPRVYEWAVSIGRCGGDRLPDERGVLRGVRESICPKPDRRAGRALNAVDPAGSFSSRQPSHDAVATRITS
jgi:hypothetical protein